MSAQLDPQIAAIVEAQAERGMPRAFEGGIGVARARFRAAISALPQDPSVSAMAATRDLGDSPVPARLYMPARSVSDVLIVWFHGGGYALGDLDLFDETARRLCAGTGARVVAIGYRQAPEYPFPYPFDDALNATQWVIDHARALGGCPDRVVVAGESSGANLAASTALHLRNQGVALLAQLLVVPGVDLARVLPPEAVYPMLTARDLADIRDNLVPAGVRLDAFPPSPLYAADLSELAPAILVTAGHDPLQREGAAYGERMEAAGVAVMRLHFPTMHHQFLGFAGASEGAARAVATICDTLKAFVAARIMDDQETG